MKAKDYRKIYNDTEISVINEIKGHIKRLGERLEDIFNNFDESVAENGVSVYEEDDYFQEVIGLKMEGDTIIVHILDSFGNDAGDLKAVDLDLNQLILILGLIEDLQ